VGTPLYSKMYENYSATTGRIGTSEMELIHQRLIGTEQAKLTVLPLLLDGEKHESLPPLMRGRVVGDFRKEAFYFSQLFDLILTIYRISFEESAVIDLRDSLSALAREDREFAAVPA
jgi:hypothetical protein